jgi:hypothetical protein
MLILMTKGLVEMDAAIRPAAELVCAAKSEAWAGRVAKRPAASAVRQKGESRRPVDCGGACGGAAEKEAGASASACLLGLLAQGAQADTLPAQGRAERFGIDADDLRDFTRPQRRQRRHDFCELARRPAAPPCRASESESRGTIGL